MESAYEWLIAPFVEYGFMRRALVGSWAVALGASPLGVFLMLRRMTLVGDAMGHAILPGVAIAYWLSGLSLLAMTLGGLLAGLLVAILTSAVSRLTRLQEDASLAAFYLSSLAFGVLLISLKGNSVDLMHLLFGSVLALDQTALLLVASIASLSLLILSVLYRPLVLDCLDPSYCRSVSPLGHWIPLLFLSLVMLNLVGGFHALGTLMAVGMLILPAVIARFWALQLGGLLLVAVGAALTGSLSGLLLSYHFELPSGPAIVLSLGLMYGVSILVGSQHSMWAQRARPALNSMESS